MITVKEASKTFRKLSNAVLAAAISAEEFRMATTATVTCATTTCATAGDYYVGEIITADMMNHIAEDVIQVEWQCEHCSTPQDWERKNCSQCGAPRYEVRE